MEGVVITARYSRDGIDWIIDDKEAYRALRQMVSNVSDFRPYWPKIEDAIREDVSQRFATKDGGTWKPNQAKYAKWKLSHGGAGPLVMKGMLLKASTVAGQQTVRRGVREMTWNIKDLVLNLGRVRRIGSVINPNSPFLRKRMGDAAGEIAIEWKRQWEAGR